MLYGLLVARIIFHLASNDLMDTLNTVDHAGTVIYNGSDIALPHELVKYAVQLASRDARSPLRALGCDISAADSAGGVRAVCEHECQVSCEAWSQAENCCSAEQLDHTHMTLHMWHGVFVP